MTDPAPQTDLTHCMNCQHALAGGVYCPACGQRNVHQRLNWQDLWADLKEQVLEINLPWLRTVIDLTLRPGRTALDYLEGHRIKYVNPLKYQIYAFVLLILCYRMLDSASLEEDANGLRVFFYENPAILMLLLTPVAVALLKLLTWKSPRNVVETWVFLFYMTGQLAVFGIAGIPMAAFSGWLGELLGLREFFGLLGVLFWFIGFPIYTAFAARTYFRIRLDHAFVALVVTTAGLTYVFFKIWFFLIMGE